MSDNILLKQVYDWESKHPNNVYMTQPYDGGKTKDYTWKQTMDEARRMAAYLIFLHLEPGSRIAQIFLFERRNGLYDSIPLFVFLDQLAIRKISIKGFLFLFSFLSILFVIGNRCMIVVAVDVVPTFGSIATAVVCGSFRLRDCVVVISDIHQYGGYP